MSREGRSKARKAPKEFRVTLVNIVVILVVVGLVMWLINTYIPMAGRYQEFTQHCRVRSCVDLAFANVRVDRSDPRTQDAGAEVIGDRLQMKLDVNRQATNQAASKARHSSSSRAAFVAR